MQSTVDKLKQVQLRIPTAIAIGLIVCIASGWLIGSASFSTLKRITLMLLFLAYVLFWQGHTWKLGLAICLFGFSHIGFGFRIGVVELSAVAAFVLIAASFWRKRRMTRPVVMELVCFQVFNLTLLVWLLYSVGHAVYTIMDPFRPYDFALKNFMKTIVAMTGPPLLVFYFMHQPRGIIANSKMPGAVIWIGLTALVVNIVIRIWGMMHGAYNPDLVVDLDAPGYFEIPGLDLVESPYILRSLTLFTATTSAVLLGSKWLEARGPGFRALVYSLLGLSFIGAVMSGGRGAIIFAFVLAGAALWMCRYYRTVLTAMGFGVLIFISLNLIPGVLRTVPPILQRSLQMIIFTDESEFAAVDIASSSSWRLELVRRSFDEWRSDPRVFWSGRGTYKFTHEDLIARQRNRGEGDMEISLRRGTTHSLVTDLLVIYGLVGMIIYFAMMFSLLWFLWRVYKHPTTDEVARMMTLACFLLLSFLFAYGIVGGASFPIDVAWLLIAVFGYLYGEANKRQVVRPKTALPAKTPLNPRRPLPALPGSGRASALH